MENASKALIMAAGILIGLLIISLAVYLFIDFGSTAAEINTLNDKKHLNQFNTKFTSYTDKELTIYDVVTVVNYAKENNKYYQGINEYQITVMLGTDNLTNKDENDLNSLIINDKNAITGSSTKLPVYECKSENIRYENGRVKTINFTR